MLLILMYHRVHGVGGGTDALRTHLRYILDHHPVVLPGDTLPRSEVAVCLTFDDATADFYHLVFPLLESLDTRALVAIPTAYIKSTTPTPLGRRLAAQESAALSGDYGAGESPLCTWSELRTLIESGRVNCASHTHTHADMTAPETVIDAELALSARSIAEQLGAAPDTFVYPYGRTDRSVQQRVHHRFPYAMRIGTALNVGWNDNRGLLYRVDAEQFWPLGKTWSFTNAVRYRLKYLGNRMRGK